MPSNRTPFQSIQNGRCIFLISPSHQYIPEPSLSLNGPSQGTTSKPLTTRSILSTLTSKSTSSPRTSPSSTTTSSTTLTPIKRTRSALGPLFKSLLIRFNQTRRLITQSQTKDLQPAQLNTTSKHNRFFNLI